VVGEMAGDSATSGERSLDRATAWCE